METPNFNSYVELLKQEVAARFNMPLKTSANFESLSIAIRESGAGYLSVSTLKRLWGYIKDTQSKHQSTLDILARYVGYSNFHAFCNAKIQAGMESGFPGGNALAAETLEEGAIVNMTWLPNRELTMKYIGDMTFEIVRTVNTRLSVGMQVRCIRLIAGAPLLLDIVNDSTIDGMVYFVGQHSGIRWNLADC